MRTALATRCRMVAQQTPNARHGSVAIKKKEPHRRARCRQVRVRLPMCTVGGRRRLRVTASSKVDRLGWARPPHILGGLILSQSLVCALPHQPVGGPRQKAHFTDQLGPNPGDPREIERDPKRAVVGGGTSSGIFGVRSGWSASCR
jgi:hypothetical protein